ncbi:MAG: putative zinc-binding protein [Firmicutes bacterium]|nr:putative zinc-binding protein [Bacillota bacterium]
MAVEKVVILPCMGIGQPISGITRLAAYIVNEDLLPGQTLIECIPALIRGVKEDVDMAEQYPVIVIDGCPDKCASGICCTIGIKPIARLYAIDVIRETGLKPDNVRQEITESGKKLARELSRQITEVAKEMLSDPGFQFQKQKLSIENRNICQYDIDPDQTLGYVKINACWSRPESMPELAVFKK